MVSIIVLEYLARLEGEYQSLSAQTMEYQSWRKIFCEKAIVYAPNLLAPHNFCKTKFQNKDTALMAIAGWLSKSNM